jgi:hypothetical protein
VNHNKNKEVRGPHRWDTDGLFAFSSWRIKKNKEE